MGWESLVSCLSGGYKFASVLRCVGLVVYLGNFELVNNFFKEISCEFDSSF